MIAGDINVYSPVWNSYYYQKQNAFILKKIIDKYGLLVNNKPRCSTQVVSPTILVINLTLSTSKLRFLTLWKILKEYPAL